MAILSYDFQVIGAQNVERALSSLERRFAQHNSRMTRELGVPRAGSARSVGSPQQAAAQRQRELDRTLRTQAAIARQRVKEERDVARAASLAAREKQRAIDRQLSTQRALASQRRREESAELAHNRRIENEARRTIERRRSERQRFVSATVGNASSRVLGGVASVGRLGAAAVGIGGAAIASSAVSQAAKLDEMARRFSVAGRGKGEAGLDADAIRKRVSSIGIARGVSPEAVMAGAAKFQAVTGNATAALGMSDMFATVAQATGGDPAEVAEAAAALFQNLKIDDIDSMADALSRLTFQGKKGSFEFKDLASQLGRVTASFGGRGVTKDSLGDIGGILQIVQKGTGEAAVTTTAVDAMFRQMIAKARDIQSGAAFGGNKVQVFKGGDATKGIRGDIGGLIADVLAASGGNAIQLTKLFGDEGMRGMNMFATEFQRASTAAGGGKVGTEAGRNAVVAMISEFSAVGGDYNEIQRDANDAMKSFSVQLEVINTRLKDAIGSQLFPVIARLVPQMTELVPAATTVTQELLSLATAIANNPWSSVASVVGASIAAEIGKAQLSALISDTIAGKLGALGSAGLVIGSLGATIATAQLIVETMKERAERSVNAAAEKADEVRSKARAEIVSTGKLSPATRKELEQLSETERRTLAAGSAANKEGFSFKRAFNSIVGDDENLQQGLTLGAAAGSEKFQRGAFETKALLDPVVQEALSRSAKSIEVAGEKLNAAADKLSSAGGGRAPNRSDSPSSPVKG